MAAQSLFDDCQTLIEKGHEKWKTYFSKWESFAKYEEDLPESEMFSAPKKKSGLPDKKKVKWKSVLKKSKVQSSVKYKKNQISKKKHSRGKRETTNNKQGVKTVEEYNDVNNESVIVEMDNTQFETILKSVVTEVLKTNRNDCQMFTVLSQTISNSSELFHHQLACNISNPLQLIRGFNNDVSSVYPYRRSYIGNLNSRRSLFEFQTNPHIQNRKQTGYFNLSDTFPEFKIHHSQLNQSQFLIGSPTLRQNRQISLSIKNGSPPFSSRLRHPNTESEWDSSLKSPNRIYRKINNEYYIKRSFLKMSITHDAKRFGNLCLCKRTNSVTLSRENSNFITPERKPPERKCFSENVLQRKRSYPSKLFFGNEDSESDDESGKQTPIICCRKKLKTKAIPHDIAVSDDLDDCESIFDRVCVS